MASYKVAQDVEAEDKLLGPFTFRQFIYIVIAVMAGIVAYGLSRVFLPLAIIPSPIIIFFLILALPLRKDQPMEIYLAAIVSFYLKPRKRLWRPDGIHSLIEITVPANQEIQRTKDLSGSEAEKRLAYLATLADTRGWSIRNAGAPIENSSMVGDVYNEAQSYTDLFDESGAVAQAFEDRISRADAARRQAMIDGMKTPGQPAPQPIQAPPAPIPQPDQTPPAPATSTTPVQASPAVSPEPTPVYNPYPTSMRQHVISPSGTVSQPEPQPQPQTPAPEPPKTESSSTSDNTVSPDIINLANNTDLSIDTIAREAHRINEKKSRNDPGEVVISLR